MIRLCVAATIALAFGAAGSAVADPTDGPTAAFTYTYGHSIQENYDDFRKVSRKACHQPARDSLARWAAEKAECESNLLNQAIRSFSIPELSEWHIAQTEGIEAPRQYAAK